MIKVGELKQLSSWNQGLRITIETVRANRKSTGHCSCEHQLTKPGLFQELTDALARLLTVEAADKTGPDARSPWAAQTTQAPDQMTFLHCPQVPENSGRKDEIGGRHREIGIRKGRIRAAEVDLGCQIQGRDRGLSMGNELGVDLNEKG